MAFKQKKKQFSSPVGGLGGGLGLARFGQASKGQCACCFQVLQPSETLQLFPWQMKMNMTVMGNDGTGGSSTSPFSTTSSSSSQGK